MKILVTGGAKNGKSGFAQALCCRLSEHGKRFYLATMLPFDAEDVKRIERHVSDRKGLGFITVECAMNIRDALIPDMQGGCNSVLVDSLTALLANEMFPRSHSSSFKCNADAPRNVARDLVYVASTVDNVVFVSDGIFNDSFRYDDMTDAYRKGLAMCEQSLVHVCDTVVEMVAGIPVVQKGTLEMSCTERTFEKKTYLIVGGAHQGKLSYAKECYGLSQSDVSLCERDSLPDFSKKCVARIENYVWYCLKNNVPMISDFPNGTIIIANDIFCGIVPMDAFERKWRETCGTYLQKLAKCSCVTRIVCGIPQIVQQ